MYFFRLHHPETLPYSYVCKLSLDNRKKVRKKLPAFHTPVSTLLTIIGSEKREAYLFLDFQPQKSEETEGRTGSYLPSALLHRTGKLIWNYTTHVLHSSTCTHSSTKGLIPLVLPVYSLNVHY